MEWISDGSRSACPTARGRWTLATRCYCWRDSAVGNHLTASRQGETLARDFAYDLLQSVEPYGVLVTAGDNDTSHCGTRRVEHVRQDVRS